MEAVAKIISSFRYILPQRYEPAAPITEIKLSEAEHCYIGGFNARESSTPISVKGSVTSSFGSKKRSVSIQGSRPPSSELRAHWTKAEPSGVKRASHSIIETVGLESNNLRARWTKAEPSGVKRASHSIIETVDLESNNEISALEPPMKKVKMEPRQNPNGVSSDGEEDVEVLKVVCGKKVSGFRNSLKFPQLFPYLRRPVRKTFALSLEDQREDKKRYSDLLQVHVYSTFNLEKPIESAGLRTRLALGNATPAVVDLRETKKTAPAQSRVQVDRRRSVTPVTQATGKPREPHRKSETNADLHKYLKGRLTHELVSKENFSLWQKDLHRKHQTTREEIKAVQKESELLNKLNVAAQKKKKEEDEEILSKRLQSYLHVAESFPEEEDEEEEIPIPKLTDEMEREVEKALKGNPSDVLAEAFSLKILRRDIHTLRGLNWLNDEIINFFMNLLMDRGKQEKYPSVYAFNTFFYPRLISSGHSALKRWTKKVDIFSYDFVLAPVHLGVHWCMAIIDMQEKSVKYFDSMGGENGQCLKALRQYLCDERMDKKKEKMDLTGWEFKCMKDIPQQENGSDCGMFSCMFAEYTTRRAPITFSQSDMPNFRRIMIYEIIKKKLLC